MLLATVPAVATAAPVNGTNVLYTLDAHFDQGVLQDVNHDTPNDNQLQLSKSEVFFPFVNIAASARGTMVRIDVNTGATVGEWFTAPNNRGRNPSRTTVDRLGNTWVSNRNESSGGKGSVTRVGVITGGTRVNADGTANPSGDYLKGPFSYNTCVDRNSDNLIATSRGLGDIRPWTDAASDAGNDGVATAADECVINYTRVTGTNTRTVAVDADNDVWTGGADTDHEKISGSSGQPVPGTQINFGCGGYGGLIDQAGRLWSARFGNNLLRYVPATNSGACLDTSRGDYGLGMDPNTGEIWHTFLFGNRVTKINPADGSVIASYPHGNDNAQGVAVDRNNNVWVAHSLFGATTVGHLRTDGTLVGNVPLPGGNGPTGVAVDTNGKIWVANINSNNAMRIDPNAGPIGGGGFPVGAVDLTVDLGAGAGPYNYSDMTGSVLGEITAPVGTWTAVQDGGNANVPWGKVTWNTEPQGSVPPGTSITFEARASNTEAGLAGETFVPVSNNALFSLTGRYIEVRATLRASPSGVSPVLSDVRIETNTTPVRVAKTCTPATVLPSGTVTCTVTVTNDGPVPATGVSFVDVLDPALTLNPVAPQAGFTCTTSNQGHQLSCTRATDLPANSSAAVTYTATLSPDAAPDAAFPNTVTLTATNDSTPGDNTATATTRTPTCTLGNPTATGPQAVIGTQGNDVICTGPGNDSINGFGGDDVVFAGAGNDSINGGNGNDTLFGGDGVDSINGAGGNDALFGGNGNDTLVGGSDIDTIDGGPGTDNCIPGGSGESVTNCP